MTFTVRSLLDLPNARTVSLTPGIGEDRTITWAHVCELSEPWRWLGRGALVMTTGIGVPKTSDEQCIYLEGMHRAGIAAVAIDGVLIETSFTAAALAYAARLGFPVLQTAHEVPFVTLAMAVADSAQQDRAARVQQAEQMYAALGEHPDEAPIEALLLDLEPLLGGPLALLPRGSLGIASAPGAIQRVSHNVIAMAVHAPGDPELRFESPLPINRGLLQHVVGIVSSALSIKAANHRSEWLHGALLLADLCNDSVTSGPAEHLVAAHRVEPPYLLAVLRNDSTRDSIDRVHSVFTARRIPALATTQDGQVLILAGASDELDRALDALADEDTRVGVSAAFSGLDELQSALRQARSALIRNHQAGRVMRFEEHESSSLFLPNNTEQLRHIARQVLGPLQTYDEQRGTSLTQTLRVFLEENRSWVRASERLFVHRQTLIARVSRIEKIIVRDLSSMEDTAECWLAVQAAIGCGDLEPNDVASRSDDPEDGPSSEV